MFALKMFFLFCIVWPVGRWERSRVISCCGFYFSPWRHWGFIRRKDVLIWPETKCFIKLQIKIVLWQKIYMNIFFFLITIYMWIWFVCLFVLVFVCLFVSNKRQNGWTDRAQIFCGTIETPGKVYEWSKF